MKKFLLTAMLSTLSSHSFAVAPAESILTSDVNGVDVSLSWPKVDGASGYALYYVPAPYENDEGDVVRLDQGDNNSFAKELFPGADYLVAIKAYNSNQEESGYSNIKRVTISQAPVVYMALNRQRSNGIDLKGGVFQILVDLDQKYSNLELFAPNGESYGQFTVKGDNQAEIYITDSLAKMKPYLLQGEYRIGNDGASLPLTTVKSGSYPSYPEIHSPKHGDVNVGINPVIEYTAVFPATIAITDIEAGKKEVFFSKFAEVGENETKSFKIESIDLKPNTEYLLEINIINRDAAKGSTSSIKFRTK